MLVWTSDGSLQLDSHRIGCRPRKTASRVAPTLWSKELLMSEAEGGVIVTKDQVKLLMTLNSKNQSWCSVIQLVMQSQEWR